MSIGGWAPAAARRIRDAALRVERAKRNDPIPGKNLPAPVFSGLLPVVLTSGIAAGSTASPATATASPLRANSSTSAALASYTPTVTVYNLNTKSVASGKFAWVTPYNGRLYLVTADC